MSIRSTKGLKEIIKLNRTQEMNTDGLGQIQKRSAQTPQESQVDLLERIQDLQREIEQRTQAVLGVQRNFESLSVICKNEKAENAKLRQMLEQTKEECRQIKQDKSIVDKRVIDLLQRINKYESLEKENTNNEKKNNMKSVEEIMTLRLKIDELEKMLEKKKFEYNDLHILFKNEQTNFEKSQNQSILHDNLKKQLAEYKINMQMAQQDIKKGQKCIAHQKQCITQFEQEITQLQSVNQNFLNQINNLKSAITKQQQENLSLQNQLSNQTEIITKLNSDLIQYQNQHNELKLTKQLSEIESQNKQLIQENKSIDQKNELLNDLNNQIQNLKSEKDSLQKLQIALQQKLVDKDNQIKKLSEDANLETLKCSNLKQKLEALEEQIQYKQQRINQLEKNNEESLKKTQSLQQVSMGNVFSSEILKLKEQLDSKISNANNINSKQKEIQIQIDTLKQRTKDLETRENVLTAVIAKIQYTEESTTPNLSCCSCMEILKQPMTCIPCGHNYCISCVQANQCQECNSTYEQVYRNHILDDIISKFFYKKQVLESIKSTIKL